ncbi:Spindle associated protein [Lasiodiplodia theobromae]|uniref:Spindle associated protein n=1 Tax=Lasiodiplodia theobromae TaxID=45133 RepID=UPI0015C35264|nr:Spindle associated protein [Lasiodiplodia theobromae]KAF4542197.1 Spindle associated protein [Lasiodiplodia theobromae]
MDHSLPFNNESRALQTPIRAPLLSSPTSAEPKSEYLRQRLRERRQDLGMTDQSLPRALSLSEPKPSRAMDDYIFASEEEQKKSRRRARGQTSRIPSNASQHSSASTQRAQSYSMGSREQQTNLDKMSKDNFDLKLRLTLVEERSHRFENELEEALEKLERMNAVEEERDELSEENTALCDRVEELRRSQEACEQKLRDSWKMTGEVFAELEKRDAAIKEALDMYLDSERRIQELEAELIRYKPAPRRRDSSYFSTGPDSAGIRTADEVSRPASSQLGGQRDGFSSSAPPSPERHDTVAHLASSRPLSQRYSTLVRTMSAGDIRLNDLRERASTAHVGESAVEECGSLHASPVQRRRTLRRSSASPKMDRSSSKASSSTHSHGLRNVYLEGERGGRSPSFSESIRAPSDVTSSSDLGASQYFSATEAGPFSGSSPWPASSSPLGAYQDSRDVASIADSDQGEGTVIHDDAGDTRSDMTHFEDEDYTTPTASEAPSILTEFRPGQYPQWPGAGGKYGLGRDLFFNGEGLDDVPRGRRKG